MCLFYGSNSSLIYKQNLISRATALCINRALLYLVHCIYSNQIYFDPVLIAVPIYWLRVTLSVVCNIRKCNWRQLVTQNVIIKLKS